MQKYVKRQDKDTIREMKKATAPVRKTKGGPSEYDVSIGSRVRMQRTIMGWSQEKLAGALDITFQQVQKYENGMNRISAGRLYEIAQLMGVPIATFFAGIQLGGLNDQDQAPLEDPGTAKDTAELLKAYHSLPEGQVRRQFVAFAKSMAENLIKAK